jgi:hypothetical protein
MLKNYMNFVFSYFVKLARVLKEKKSGRDNLKIASPAFCGGDRNRTGVQT